MKIQLLFLVLFSLIKLNDCFLFESYLGYTAAIGALGIAYKYKCSYVECCEIFDKDNLKERIQSRLHWLLIGQPIANQVIPDAISSHVNKKYPSNPLVISMHGWTGNGKTYTSKLIAETLFEKGLKSIHVKKITPATIFPNANRVQEYKEILIRELEDQSYLCKHSLIIIEEIDKLHPELIEVLASYLNNYNPKLNHLIFIFTSNVGSDKIVERTFELYNSGRKREDYQLLDFEHLIKNQVYNDETTMKYSSLISSHLINHYIPYLPLERQHIIRCLERYISSGYFGYRRDYYDKEKLKSLVVQSLEWWPSDLKLYSNSGCKQVESKADVLVRQAMH